MGRLVNGERKITNPIPEHAGKLLISAKEPRNIITWITSRYIWRIICG